MLRKKLSRHGNSLALVIDKPILELLGIDENTLLEITTDGKTLRIAAEVTPDEQDRLFAEAKAFVFTNYDEALAELAK
jgi:antitoxin component of MazEF toxin-antitoxin module